MGEENKDEQISNTSTKVYTLAEIAEHKTTDSCWIVVHDKVYDVTKFLDEVSDFFSFLIGIQGDLGRPERDVRAKMNPGRLHRSAESSWHFFLLKKKKCVGSNV